MKKHLFLVCLFFGLIPISCRKTTCGLNHINDFKINSFNLLTVDLSGNPVDTAMFTDADNIAKLLTIKEKTEVAVNSTTSISFYSTALACDPRMPVSVDEISQIQVISKTNFTFRGESVQVGDTITDYFLINPNFDSFIPIQQYLQSSRKGLGLNSELYFKLKEKPTTELALTFDLVVILSSNVSHTFEDELLKVK